MIYMRISPCSWMYKNYGLQIGLSLTPDACNAETIFVNRKGIDCESMPRAEMRVLAQAMADQWEAVNGESTLQSKVIESRAESARFALEWAKEEKKEAAARQRRVAKYRKQGYTHRLAGWIHPQSGDDYPVEFYTVGAPDVARLLARCTVKTDFTICAF